MLKGKHKVKDRWYGRRIKESLWSKRYEPHAELSRKPQFTFEQLYRSVFTEERCSTSTGKVSYVKLPDRSKSSGIEILDLYIDHLDKGDLSVISRLQKLVHVPASDRTPICIISINGNVVARPLSAPYVTSAE